MQDKIRQRVKELLESGEVKLFIGWGKGSSETRMHPVIIRKPEQAERLVWNKFCLDNLSRYLTRKELSDKGKIGIVSKGCDNKAIIGLLQEFKLERSQVYILGVFCEGMGEPLQDKCRFCDVHTPVICDELIGEPQELKPEEGHYEEEEEFLNKPREERWEFWQRELAKCIRCYACRQACPLCYCERCIVDKNQPQWIDSSAHQRGNLAWNIIRAFHLAGRCIECGECERACPVNIPLMKLNKFLARVVQDLYEYEAGKNAEAKPPLTEFKDHDDESFIL